MSKRVFAGRYGLVKRLGAGPMSEVWLAEDAQLDRPVALKLLGRDADRARFEREARAAAALAHPNITQLYDYGEAGDRPYMVFEYLPGGTLEQRLPHGEALEDDETRRIAGGIAAGLAHAHEHGLVHRDLKPANVLFDGEDRPKIADFGIASVGGDGGTLTEAGTLLGTAAYISPEQAAARAATPASDVYSFGVVLFRMLTGTLPFEAAEPMELVRLHRDVEAPPVSSRRPDAPPDLAALADAALAKEPRRRPADGAALANALGGATASTSAPVAPAEAATQVLATPPSSTPPRRRRLPLLAGAAALLLAAGGVGLALAVTHTSGSSEDTPSVDTSIHSRKLPTLKTAPTTAAVSPPPAEPTTREETTRPTTTQQATSAPTTATAPATTEPLPTTEPSTTVETTVTLPPTTEPLP